MIQNDTKMTRGTCYYMGHTEERSKCRDMTFAELKEWKGNDCMDVQLNYVVLHSKPDSTGSILWSEFWYPVAES